MILDTLKDDKVTIGRMRCSMAKRSFTTEFKRDAASLVLDQGYSVAQACEAMNVGDGVMRRWVDQLRRERNGQTPLSKALTPEQQRIQELEARLRKVEREKDILKKATALLMSDSLDQ
jgi:transposase